MPTLACAGCLHPHHPAPWTHSLNRAAATSLPAPCRSESIATNSACRVPYRQRDVDVWLCGCVCGGVRKLHAVQPVCRDCISGVLQHADGPMHCPAQDKALPCYCSLPLLPKPLPRPSSHFAPCWSCCCPWLPPGRHALPHTPPAPPILPSPCRPAGQGHQVW